MERSMTHEEWQEEMLMNRLREIWGDPIRTREDSLKRLAEMEAQNQNKK